MRNSDANFRAIKMHAQASFFCKDELTSEEWSQQDRRLGFLAQQQETKNLRHPDQAQNDKNNNSRLGFLPQQHEAKKDTSFRTCFGIYPTKYDSEQSLYNPKAGKMLNQVQHDRKIEL